MTRKIICDTSILTEGLDKPDPDTVVLQVGRGDKSGQRLMGMTYGFDKWNTILFYKTAPLGSRWEICEVRTIGLDGIE